MSRFTPLSGYPQLLAEGVSFTGQNTILPDTFGGSSTLQFPSRSWHTFTGQQTGFIQFRARAAPAAPGFGYLFAATDVNGNGGVRFFLNDNSGNPTLLVGADSTGSAFNPQRQGVANCVAYGKVQHVAYTWDGGLSAANMHLFCSQDGARMVSVDDTQTDGTTAIYTITTTELTVGNRTGGGRGFDGDIFVHARWSRILTLPELWVVQERTPLAVPDGLMWCYFNRTARGHNFQMPSVTTSITTGAPSAFVPLIPGV